MKTHVRLRSGLELTLAVPVEQFKSAWVGGGLRNFASLDWADPIEVWIVMSEVECFWSTKPH